jgi:hypothetical protein
VSAHLAGRIVHGVHDVEGEAVALLQHQQREERATNAGGELDHAQRGGGGGG